MKLKPCPDSPNCVSSQSVDKAHYIKPIPYTSDTPEALQKIKQTILKFPRVRLVNENDQSLHFEFQSRFLKYIDDVEIIIDGEEKIIHIRSASRTGYSDLGVNRRRVEKIRKKFSSL